MKFGRGNNVDNKKYKNIWMLFEIRIIEFNTVAKRRKQRIYGVILKLWYLTD